MQNFILPLLLATLFGKLKKKKRQVYKLHEEKLNIWASLIPFFPCIINKESIIFIFHWALKII